MPSNSPEYARAHYLANKAHRAAIRKIKWRSEPHYRAQRLAANAFYRAWAPIRDFALGFGPKPTKEQAAEFRKIVKCSYQTFLAHIELYWTEGMEWKNYGEFWNFDHVKPQATFDHRIPAQSSRCWSYTNMRPRLKVDNTSRGVPRHVILFRGG